MTNCWSPRTLHNVISSLYQNVREYFSALIVSTAVQFVPHFVHPWLGCCGFLPPFCFILKKWNRFASPAASFVLPVRCIDSTCVRHMFPRCYVACTGHATPWHPAFENVQKKNPFSMHTSKNNPWTHACIKSRSQYECTTEKRREEWTNEWMIEWLDEGIKEWRNEGKKEWRNERRKEWRKEGMREWMNEGITERMNGGMNERKNEEMNQWINETQMHWINGSIRW